MCTTNVEGLDAVPVAIKTLASATDDKDRINAVIQIRTVLAIEEGAPIDLVIAAGAIPELVAVLSDPNPRLVFEAAWALTNVASGSDVHVDHILAEEGALEAICTDLVAHTDREVRDQAIWCIGNLASTSVEIRDRILGLGILDNLLPMMAADGERVSSLRNATWTLSNLVLVYCYFLVDFPAGIKGGEGVAVMGFVVLNVLILRNIRRLVVRL